MKSLKEKLIYDTSCNGEVAGELSTATQKLRSAMRDIGILELVAYHNCGTVSAHEIDADTSALEKAFAFHYLATGPKKLLADAIKSIQKASKLIDVLERGASSEDQKEKIDFWHKTTDIWRDVVKEKEDEEH